MRPLRVEMSALGNSPWVPVNYMQNAFAIGLAVVLSSGAVLTYTVQHAFNDLSDDGKRKVLIARAGTVATVTDIGHKLSVADSVIVTGSGSVVLDGQPDIASVVDADHYTYTVANSGPAAGSPNTFAKPLHVFPHASLAGLNIRSDGNYAFNVEAIRLNISAYTSGTAILLINQGMGR